jgi:acyl dehydratase
MKAPRTTSFSKIVEGFELEQDYVLTKSVSVGFLHTFRDFSPLHVDVEFAKAAGFKGPIMHGGILNGFVSHFVGMVFPGASSLLLSTELRFLRPTYLNDRFRLKAKVAQKIDSENVIVLHLTFLNRTRDETAANGRVTVKVKES